MLGTERGRTWLAKWHRTTPSVRAAPRSLGRDTFNRDSMFCGKPTGTGRAQSCLLPAASLCTSLYEAELLHYNSVCPLAFPNSFVNNPKESPVHYCGAGLATVWEQMSSTVFTVQHSGLIQPLFKNNGTQDLGTVFLTLHILREWLCQGK